jgi:hypothetical protein
MPGRTFTVELTDDQAAILDEIAAAQRTTPDAVLIDAVGHGLAMITAGVDDDELHQATRDPPPEAFAPVLPEPPRKRRQRKQASWNGPPGNNGQDDDIPF